MNKLMLAGLLGGMTTVAFGQTAQNTSVPKGPEGAEELQEVVVTGTLIRGEAPIG